MSDSHLPCHALTMPFFSRPRHSMAVKRRPVGYLPAFGFFRLLHEVPRRLLSEAYQSSSQRSIPTTLKSGSSTLQKRRSVKLGLAVQIFPATTRTFTKDTALSERSRAQVRHGMCELTHGMAGEQHWCGTLCVNRPLYIYVHLLGSLPQPIITNLHETGWQGMDCIYLAHNRGKWWADVNMVMNLSVL